jgi:hypothetical protein
MPTIHGAKPKQPNGNYFMPFKKLLYKSKELVQLIDEEILNPELSYSDFLKRVDTDALYGLAMLALGEDMVLAMTESDDLLPFIFIFRSYMVRRTEDSKQEYIDKTESMLTGFLDKHLQPLFEERQEILDYERHVDAGCYPTTNPQTGELIWIKRGGVGRTA